MGYSSISEELSYQREVENYTDPFAVVIMKDDNRAKNVLRHTCKFAPETFVGMNFPKIVLPRKKQKLASHISNLLVCFQQAIQCCIPSPSPSIIMNFWYRT